MSSQGTHAIKKMDQEILPERPLGKQVRFTFVPIYDEILGNSSGHKPAEKNDEEDYPASMVEGQILAPRQDLLKKLEHTRALRLRADHISSAAAKLKKEVKCACLPVNKKAIEIEREGKQHYGLPVDGDEDWVDLAGAQTSEPFVVVKPK